MTVFLQWSDTELKGGEEEAEEEYGDDFDEDGEDSVCS